MLYKKVLFALLTIFLFSNSFSQSIEKEKLDQYIHSLDSNEKLMGVVLISQQGQTIYSNALGFSNISTGVKSNKLSMYRIGSISKTITATLVLKAVEEKKLDTAKTIQSFFPTIKNADQIKISDLLNHHSGIHNFTGGNFTSWNTKPINRHDLIDTIAKGGSDFAPGSKAAYSNSNYVLLSFILEDVYHKSYEAILTEKIIKPLQLQHFQFGDKQIAPNNKAISYNFEAGWNAAAETDLSIPMGAGGILSSAEDLAKVMYAIFQGKIISTQMLQKMKTQVDGYGFGLFEKNIAGKKAYTHDGAIDGFNSYFYFIPETQTIYVLLSNAENYPLEKVNNTAMSIVFNQPVDLPSFANYKVSVKELDQYTGKYSSTSSPLVIDIWNKNNFLLAQPHGQRIYTMTATDRNKFSHDKTGVTLDFNPAEKQMILKQGLQSIVFTKE
ncbi:MAG: serine hydrolase domain-containing protein [Chitinophagaceae bacterium]